MADEETPPGGSLEQRVGSLEVRMDESERKADDTRQLAAFVDRDQHRMEQKIDNLARRTDNLAHLTDLNRQMINALGEQQAHGFAEARERFAGIDQRIDDLTLATRAGFDQVAAGMATLADLITRSQGNGTTDEAGA